MALNYVTITETFKDGSGAVVPSGLVTFTPSLAVYSASSPVATPAAPIVGQVVNGVLKAPDGVSALQLLATDNAGLAYEGLTGFFYWTVNVNVGGNTQTFSFFLPHTPSTVDLYTLANTAAGGSSGFTNPMTTLGDIIYENGTPAAARLAGSTSATKQFLTQTGTGSVSAAPAWGTIAAADVPGFDGVTVTGTPSAGQVPVATSSSAASWQAAGVQSLTFTYGSSGAVPSSGTFTAGALAVDQNEILRVCITSGTPGTWQRVGAKPYQFFVDDYGAKGDGKVLGDGVTNATTTFTSATASFASADTGKTIMINGANGPGQTPVIGTMTFVNSTTITFSTPAASASATACGFVYGSDDTAKINNAVQAAGTYALANDYYAEVIFSSKIYMLTSGPTQTLSPTFNSQIPLPYPNVNGQTQKLIIALTGAAENDQPQYWEAHTPNLQGTCLVSTVFPPNVVDPTYGFQSIIGGPTDYGAFAGNFANVRPVIKNLSLWKPVMFDTWGLDFRNMGGMYVTGSSAHAFAPPGFSGVTAAQPWLNQLSAIAFFTQRHDVGLAAPENTNNDDCSVGTFTVEGFECAYRIDEHFNAQRINALDCDAGVLVEQAGSHGGTIVHGASILYYSCEATNGALRANGGSGPQFPIFIGLMDCEVINSFDINDTSNTLTGQVNWAAFDKTAPVVQGAGALRVVNCRTGPGHMSSPPAVPATTVAATVQYRDAWVTVHTGAGVTVSAITVDGTATGLTLAASSTVAVRVPIGKTIALTYAGGTPTWDWWLD